MSSRFKARGFGLLLAAAFAAAPVLEASTEVVPSAPVKSFTLRKFTDQGVRAWDLSGGEAIFLPDQVIRVIDMQLSIFGTRGDGKPEMTLRSPLARIFIERHFGEGEGFLLIEGDGFNVQGDRWEWHGQERKITIEDHARVTFDQAIDQILNP